MISCLRSSNLSLANFKKMRPRTTCLYSEDSTEPRSLLADSQSVSSILFSLVALAIDFLLTIFPPSISRLSFSPTKKSPPKSIGRDYLILTILELRELSRECELFWIFLEYCHLLLIGTTSGDTDSFFHISYLLWCRSHRIYRYSGFLYRKGITPFSRRPSEE